MSNLHSQVNDNTPVLVGCSQYLDKKVLKVLII